MSHRTRTGLPTLVLALSGGLALPMSAVADTFTWIGASGQGWSTRANWRQNGAAAGRLPGNADDVTIATPNGTPKDVLIDQAPDGNSNVSIVVKSLTLTGPITLKLKSDNNVLRRKVYFGVTNAITVNAGALIELSRAGTLNAPGCNLELNSSTATITVAGTIRGGAPIGTGGAGGEVKLVAQRVNGTGISVTGTIEGGEGTANTVSPGGAVILQANTSVVEIKGNGCRVAGGKGSDNNAGGGGAGGPVDIRTNRTVTLGQDADTVEGSVRGGQGGNGKSQGGRGGDVNIGSNNAKVQDMTLPKLVAIIGGKGGATTDTEDAQRRALLGLGGDGGNVNIFVAGTLVNNFAIYGGTGGAAAMIARSDTRGKAGNGGAVNITTNAMTNDKDGAVIGGGADPSDYAGRGGDVTIASGAGNFINHGYIAGASAQGDARLSLRSGNGDNRAIAAPGGKVTISGRGNFQNVRKIGGEIPMIKGGDGASAMDDQHDLQGPGFPGGDVEVNFPDTNITNGGAINPGKHGFPNPAKVKGKIKLNGKDVQKLGFLGRERDGTAVAAIVEVHGVDSVTMDIGDDIQGETVSLSTADGGWINLRNPTRDSHGKIHASAWVAMTAGASGFVDFRAVNGTEGAENPAVFIRDDQGALGELRVIGSLLDDDCTCDDVVGRIEMGCPADFNGDGFLDFFDYTDFIACFEGLGCPSSKTADFNGDGFADFFDFDDFVGAFETGC